MAFASLLVAPLPRRLLPRGQGGGSQGRPLGSSSWRHPAGAAARPRPRLRSTVCRAAPPAPRSRPHPVQRAENLKKRAVVSVRTGKENEAVDLLVQKKKLTKALENIKSALSCSSKLSAKISEVMTLLSGKIDDRVDEASDSNLAGQSERSELQMTDSFTFSKDPDPTNIMDDHYAYDDFVQHIDSQLNSLQCEIEHYTNFRLAKADTQQSINDKLHKLSNILKLITETRK
ncbi:hypothetical protein ZWY2020_057510 [Hordeum vulgare]|nr:hypothetical protein ZWY2020_057510 [Hordeum vulgare]